MKRADGPSMDPGSGEWRPGDMRLWTKDELIAEIGRLEAWTDDRESLVAEVARLAQYSDALEDRVAALREALDEAVEIFEEARGHYGIEETGGPGQPATEWDEIAERMQMFAWRWKQEESDGS